jgi:hypothetical protein
MFSEGAYYVGIKTFNSLPISLKIISDKKEKIEVALKRYLITHTFNPVDKFLQFKRIDNLLEFIVPLLDKLSLT